MTSRISLDREEVDRMIMLGMDADRYQTQVIPDLQQRVIDLTRALQDLVGAIAATRPNPGLGGDVLGASTRAQKVLEAEFSPTTRGNL